MIGAVVQAFATLRTRYSTTKLPDDLNAEAVGLLQPKWPSKLDPLEFQAMASDKIRVGQKLGFDVSDATRAIWWPVISAPPKGHPMHAAAEMAYARTNGEHATVAHRTRFIEVMLEELQRNHAAQTRSAAEQRVKRSLLAETHANIAQGEFEVNAAYRPRPPDKGSAMPSADELASGGDEAPVRARGCGSAPPRPHASGRPLLWICWQKACGISLKNERCLGRRFAIPRSSFAASTHEHDDPHYSSMVQKQFSRHAPPSRSQFRAAATRPFRSHTS